MTIEEVKKEMKQEAAEVERQATIILEKSSINFFKLFQCFPNDVSHDYLMDFIFSNKCEVLVGLNDG